MISTVNAGPTLGFPPLARGSYDTTPQISTRIQTKGFPTAGKYNYIPHLIDSTSFYLYFVLLFRQSIGLT